MESFKKNFCDLLDRYENNEVGEWEKEKETNSMNPPVGERLFYLVVVFERWYDRWIFHKT